MADRRTNESSFGLPGRLTYYTYGIPQAEECGWLTARNHGPDLPRFKEIGPHHEWVKATRKPATPVAGRTWDATQKQKVWLLKNHSGTALGNNVLGDFLSVANSSYRHGQTVDWGMMQLAVGEMTDTSNAQRATSAPLLAMAAGSAGDILRLIKPQTDEWQWGQDSSATLRLAGYIEHQETLWTKDVGMIRRIKSFVSSKRFEPLRWLMVLRDSGTTIFQPEYQASPIILESRGGNGRAQPSHIAPNALVNLKKSQTGCDFHSDASVNPSARSMPPQIAVIDEGGNWTIWDISRTRSKISQGPKVQLKLCGSIQKGLRKKLPRRAAVNPQWHRIAWVGGSIRSFDEFDDSDDEEDTGTEPKTVFPALKRSSTLLLCNSKAVRLMDVETGAFLPDLTFVPEGSLEEVIDVHVNAHDPRYFFILTTSTVFVATVQYVRNPMQEKDQQMTSILHSSPHMRDKFDQSLKLIVNPGPRSLSHRTFLAFLYSSDSSWLDIFCFGMSRKQPDRVGCYHDAICLGSSNTTQVGIQTLCMTPALLTAQSRLNPAVLYYQIFSLGTDLSLTSSLGVCSSPGWDRLAAPSTKAVQTGKGTKQRKMSKERERQKMLRYLGSRFVVSDNVAEFQDGNDAVWVGREQSLRLSQCRALRRFVAPLYQHFQHLFQEIRQESFVVAPFYPVYEAIETGVLTLKVMGETMQKINFPGSIEETSKDWQEEINALQHTDPAFKLMKLFNHRGSYIEAPSLLKIFSRLKSLAHIGHLGFVSDAHEEFADGFLRKMASQIYLSGFGMMYWQRGLLDHQLSGPQDIISQTSFPDDMLIDSQASQSSSRASTPASSAVSASAISDATEDAEDRSIAILRAFTGSGAFLPRKKLEITSMWEEGEDLENYIFSIDNKTEVTEGMKRRAKLEKKEAWKRKRRETVHRQLEERGQITVQSTQPAPDTHFYSQVSQPLIEMSQSRIVPSYGPMAMSQPVAGNFGSRSDLDRPKKRIKRKGGF